MNTKKKISSLIGFSDGEIESYSRLSTSLTVLVKAWDESYIHVFFRDVIQVLDCGLGELSDFSVETAETDFLKSALQVNYEVIPSSHPYKEFLFLSVDDEPRLQIVATSFEIIYDPEIQSKDNLEN